MKDGALAAFEAWDTPTKVIAAILMLKTVGLLIYDVIVQRRENPRGDL